jgi:hypothetical protein
MPLAGWQVFIQGHDAFAPWTLGSGSYASAGPFVISGLATTVAGAGSKFSAGQLVTGAPMLAGSGMTFAAGTIGLPPSLDFSKAADSEYIGAGVV